MSRQPELEAILQARYDLESCEPSQKTECRARLNDLIETALARAGTQSVSPRTFIELIAEPYQQFKRAKRQEERARLSRLR